MPSPNTLWTNVTISEHTHERAALNFIQDRFPTREPFRAWSNFTFGADDGSMNEVDLLVVATTGVYLVEIKSFPGQLEGDAATWTWNPPDYRPQRHLDNPILLADRKAKRLKSLLMRQPALRGSKAGAGADLFIEPVVCLSDPTLRVGLTDDGSRRVYGPDTDHPESQTNKLPGIVRLFTRLEGGRRARVDRPLSEAIARSMDSAGIRESVALRTVGQYQLGELLEEGDGFQDYEAKHPQMEKERRRVRIYLTDRALSEAEQEAQLRAAKREYRALHEFVHPGVDRPLEMVESERGPAVIFHWHPEALRLDQWLRQNESQIDLLGRLDMLQDLAETVREAHRHEIYHRALSPRTVRVVERGGSPRLLICDWQNAQRTPTSGTVPTSASMLGTMHVAAHVERPEQLYLAPEVAVLPEEDAEALPIDIWSLGALAVLILSGQSPAPDADGVRRLLQEQGSLSLAAVMDAPHRELERLVRTATDREAHRRYRSVQDFLDQMSHALEDMTQPDLVDPLHAPPGAELEGGWKVTRRVGSGSSSVVLVATGEDGRQEALKIARSEEQASRLQAEHATLVKLRDRSIVETFGIATIAGRSVLRLEVAQGTLGDALRRDGRLSLDLLQRFGSDLMRAIAFLDQEGIWHRDVKPDNLGIAERGKQRERRLVLMDFSLAGADPADLRVGTRGYLDPFIEKRRTRRWDEQAERYAAAVTLYEMATGTRPSWGDGSTDPALLEDELPTIDPSLMDPAVRAGLVAFFERGLNREAAQRFDTASDMQKAWARVFEGQEAGTTHTGEGTAVADLDLSAVSKRTLLSELPLSPKVRDALERLNVSTAEDLAAIPAANLVRLSGLGAATRTEVIHLARLLREQLAAGGGAGSVDLVAEKLVPGKQAEEEHRRMAAALLGLDDDTEPVEWPTLREAIQSSGLPEARATVGLEAARVRWAKTPDVTAVRREIQALLSARGGIAGANELAGLLLSAHGSSAREPERSRRARAVVRAAVETEGILQAPAFAARRLGSRFLVALQGTATTEEGTVLWDADVLTEGAARLGEAAEELALQDPLPERDEVLRTLREVPLPDGMPELTDARVMRLAAAAAEGVAVSAQLALYPVKMPAARAVAESRAVLLSRGGLKEDAIRERIAARFPEAEELPRRPELDRLLGNIGLHWSEAQQAFALPSRGGAVSTMIPSRGTTVSHDTPDEADLAVRALDERIETLVESGGFLALTVDMGRLERAIRVVTCATGGTHVDLDARLVARLRDRIQAARGGDWSKVLAADRTPGERGWTRLVQVVRTTVAEIEAEILATKGTAVLTGLGLLARYDVMSMVDRLRDAVTVQAGGGDLRGIVVITPSQGSGTRPTIDGKSIPVITANQWSRVSGAWLKSREPQEAT